MSAEWQESPQPADSSLVGVGSTRRSDPAAATRGEPAYRVIASDLRSALLRDEYPKGTPLPTEAQLSDTYGVSRQTVRRAFQDLVTERLVERVPGRGTFARDARAYAREFGSLEDLVSIGSDAVLRVVNPLRRVVNIEAAGRLRLDMDVVYFASFVRYLEDIPFCYSQVYLSPAIGRLLTDFEALTVEGKTSPFTILHLIDQRLPHLITEVDESISVAVADAAAADALGCELGQPLLKADRSYLTNDGEYVELAVNYFLPEYYSYRVRLRRTVPPSA
jgi:GntR family transcriptional regulator